MPEKSAIQAVLRGSPGLGKKTTVFLPASCNQYAHAADDCDPSCNQSALSCSDLAPAWIRQLQSACARPADVCDPDRGCLQVATAIPGAASIGKAAAVLACA